MKAEPMKRYLMQQLMPVVAKAMVDAESQQAPDPVHFVAQQLLEVSCCVGLVRDYDVSVRQSFALSAVLSAVCGGEHACCMLLEGQAGMLQLEPQLSFAIADVESFKVAMYLYLVGLGLASLGLSTGHTKVCSV